MMEGVDLLLGNYNPPPLSRPVSSDLFPDSVWVDSDDLHLEEPEYQTRHFFSPRQESPSQRTSPFHFDADCDTATARGLLRRISSQYSQTSLSSGDNVDASVRYGNGRDFTVELMVESETQTVSHHHYQSAATFHQQPPRPQALNNTASSPVYATSALADIGGAIFAPVTTNDAPALSFDGLTCLGTEQQPSSLGSLPSFSPRSCSYSSLLQHTSPLSAADPTHPRPLSSQRPPPLSRPSSLLSSFLLSPTSPCLAEFSDLHSLSPIPPTSSPAMTTSNDSSLSCTLPFLNHASSSSSCSSSSLLSAPICQSPSDLSSSHPLSRNVTVGAEAAANGNEVAGTNDLITQSLLPDPSQSVSAQLDQPLSVDIQLAANEKKRHGGVVAPMVKRVRRQQRQRVKRANVRELFVDLGRAAGLEGDVPKASVLQSAVTLLSTQQQQINQLEGALHSADNALSVAKRTPLSTSLTCSSLASSSTSHAVSLSSSSSTSCTSSASCDPDSLALSHFPDTAPQPLSAEHADWAANRKQPSLAASCMLQFPHIMIAVGLDGRILDVNYYMMREFRCPAKSMIGRPCYEFCTWYNLTSPECRQLFKQGRDRFMAGPCAPLWKWSHACIRPNCDWCVCQGYGSLVTRDGRPQCVICVGFRNTEWTPMSHPVVHTSASQFEALVESARTQTHALESSVHHVMPTP